PADEPDGGRLDVFDLGELGETFVLEGMERSQSALRFGFWSVCDFSEEPVLEGVELLAGFVNPAPPVGLLTVDLAPKRDPCLGLAVGELSWGGLGSDWPGSRLETHERLPGNLERPSTRPAQEEGGGAGDLADSVVHAHFSLVDKQGVVGDRAGIGQLAAAQQLGSAGLDRKFDQPCEGVLGGPEHDDVVETCSAISARLLHCSAVGSHVPADRAAERSRERFGALHATDSLCRAGAKRPGLGSGESVDEPVDDDGIDGFKPISAEASFGGSLVDLGAKMLVLVDECLAGLLEGSDIGDGNLRVRVGLSFG